MVNDLNIENLLFRPPITVNTDEIFNFIKNKKILITGAAGSIGSELVRQICQFSPKCIILFDHNENGIFFLEKEILSKFPNLKIIARLGSICDEQRVDTIFKETYPDIIYHAAANKHVGLSENNISETIQNNIKGTRIVVDKSSDINCNTFVMVSTDKAVNPISIMGATKRIAESYIQLKSKTSNTNFITVRFGNVLGSAGSVVPIFKSQIENGGPITITHPEVSRYFMTIPEASQLILQASTNGITGEIFILDMGNPIKIIDLAKNMIKLAGLKIDTDISIIFSGLGPGEKMHEELSYNNENVETTNHYKILKINTKKSLPDNLINSILNLEQLPFNTNSTILKEHIFQIISEINI